MVAGPGQPTLNGAQSPQTRGRLFTHWTHKRLRITGDAVTLTRRRLFIIPTGAGFAYAAMLGVMLLFALNYNNSMIFVATFLLAAIAVNDIWSTHRNLLGIKVALVPPSVALADRTIEIEILADSGRIERRPSIEFKFSGYEGTGRNVIVGDGSVIRLTLPLLNRGLHPIPQIRIATTYPLGLFRAWSLLRFPRPLLIAPAPVPPAVYPLPLTDNGTLKDGVARSFEEEQLSGLRPYQYGDPVRRIAWRASARSNTLVSKQFQGGVQDCVIWLRWQDISMLDSETKLSILCRWILDADGMGLLYGLSLPGIELYPRQGPLHCRQCLEALALFVEA